MINLPLENSAILCDKKVVRDSKGARPLPRDSERGFLVYTGKFARIESLHGDVQGWSPLEPLTILSGYFYARKSKI